MFLHNEVKPDVPGLRYLLILSYDQFYYAPCWRASRDQIYRGGIMLERVFCCHIVLRLSKGTCLLIPDAKAEEG